MPATLQEVTQLVSDLLEDLRTVNVVITTPSHSLIYREQARAVKLMQMYCFEVVQNNYQAYSLLSSNVNSLKYVKLAATPRRKSFNTRAINPTECIPSLSKYGTA